LHWAKYTIAIPKSGLVMVASRRAQTKFSESRGSPTALIDGGRAIHSRRQGMRVLDQFALI